MNQPETAVHAHSLETISALLGYDAPAAEALRRAANQLKDEFVETISRPAQPGIASPIERLAVALRGGATDAMRSFIEYASSAHEPNTGIAYLMVMAGRERQLRQELDAGLPEEMRGRLGRLPFDSLLDLDTGHDPFGARLKALVADTSLQAETIAQQTNKFAGFFCHAPFEFATIAHTGEVYVCCPAWLRTPVGNLAEKPWDEVWNSDTALALRESIHDGSYRFCSEAMCPHLSGQTGRLLRNDEVSNPYHREIIDRQLTYLKVNPKDITVQYDRTCNLTCPSCRCDVYKAEKEEAQLIQRIHDRVWTDVIKDATRVTVAGDGDPFASPLYRQALRSFDPKKFPNVRLAFITNGLLLTPDMWQSISNCWPAIESINVSCNAATPETFRINQRGGEFSKLMENLEALAAARHRGEFPLLGLGFYIRDNSFREMKEIIRIGKRLGVDRILFGKLTLPSYLLGDLDTFRSMAVHLPGHPDHEELLEILRDPIFLDPIVYLTNLAPLVPGYVPHVSSGGNYRDGMSLAEFCTFLGLSPEQTIATEQLIARYARDYADLMSRRPSGQDASPAEVLAEIVEAGVAAPSAEEWAEFDSYTRGKTEPTTGKTFAFLARERDRELRRDLQGLLSVEQRERLSEVPLDSLGKLAEARGHFLAQVQALAARGVAAR